jgi:hypothetical protein
MIYISSESVKEAIHLYPKFRLLAGVSSLTALP